LIDKEIIDDNPYMTVENRYSEFEASENSPRSDKLRDKSEVLQNYNPMTRTYFKCSIYSPSNRLFTVDEVNSNLSGDQYLSHNLSSLNRS
jgi:hypothetical protein